MNQIHEVSIHLCGIRGFMISPASELLVSILDHFSCCGHRTGPRSASNTFAFLFSLFSIGIEVCTDCLKLSSVVIRTLLGVIASLEELAEASRNIVGVIFLLDSFQVRLQCFDIGRN